MADPKPNPIIGSKKLKSSGGGGDSPPQRLRGDKTPEASEEGETDDTATSRWKWRATDEPVDVDIDDLNLLEEMIKYHSRHGEFPFSDRGHMARFIYPWVYLCIGNASGWVKKFKEIRNKFKNTIHAPTDPSEAMEFELWNKIYGKFHDGDHDQAGPSGCS